MCYFQCKQIAAAVAQACLMDLVKQIRMGCSDCEASGCFIVSHSNPDRNQHHANSIIFKSGTYSSLLEKQALLYFLISGLCNSPLWLSRDFILNLMYPVNSSSVRSVESHGNAMCTTMERQLVPQPGRGVEHFLAKRFWVSWRSLWQSIPGVMYTKSRMQRRPASLKNVILNARNSTEGHG